MWELLSKGGPLMVPIVAGSVLALAVFLGKLAALRRHRVASPELASRILRLAEEGELEQARRACQGEETSMARILASGLAHAGLARSAIKARMEESGRRELATLGKYVGVIGVVASIEPLLGLLGTVTGMIGVFQGVVTQGVGDPAALASGIWSALVTTAAGLSAGIPAYIGWRYLTSRVDDLMGEMEEQATMVLEYVARRDGVEQHE
jgi:biopolymer transport protein ExbB